MKDVGVRALRASVERAGSAPTGGKATSPGKPAATKKPAAKKQIHSAPPEDLSQADLYKRAAVAPCPAART